MLCEPHIAARAVFHAHGAEFHTDAQGRPERAEATGLTASVADRGPCQRKVGHMAPTAGFLAVASKGRAAHADGT